MYEHRVMVELSGHDGSPHVAVWANQVRGKRAMQPFAVEANTQDAKRIYRRLVAALGDVDAGRRVDAPPTLQVSLDGWAGVLVHPVSTWERWSIEDGGYTSWSLHHEHSDTPVVTFGCRVPQPQLGAA